MDFLIGRRGKRKQAVENNRGGGVFHRRALDLQRIQLNEKLGRRPEIAGSPLQAGLAADLAIHGAQGFAQHGEHLARLQDRWQKDEGIGDD